MLTQQKLKEQEEINESERIKMEKNHETQYEKMSKLFES